MSIIKNKDSLLIYGKKADECMNRLKNTKYESAEALHEDLYDFVLAKYLLTGDVIDVYNLTELAELSVAKSIKLTKINAFKADSAHSCEGTTSAMNKKVLLMMVLQKQLGITFPPETSAEITTTLLLAEEIFKLI